MKFINACLVLLILMITGFAENANAELALKKCTTTYNIAAGGIFKWNNILGDGCQCPFDGNNCSITIVKTFEEETAEKVTGGWIIHSGIQPSIAEITPVTGNPFVEDISNSLYTFPDGTTMTISECDDYPELVGRVIDLGGQQTDINGMVNIFISE